MGKGTNLISELSTFFEKSENNRAIDCILGMMEGIRISEKSIGLSKMYNCKMSSWQVLCLLLVFPFFCVKNALQYETSTLGRLFRCKKDMFYDFMNSDLVNWRKILDLVNRQLLRIVAEEESKRQQQRGVPLLRGRRALGNDLREAGTCDGDNNIFSAHSRRICRFFAANACKLE